jgi:hypothetical protein
MKMVVKQARSVSTSRYSAQSIPLFLVKCCITYNPKYSNTFLPLGNIHFNTGPEGNALTVSSQTADTTYKIKVQNIVGATNWANVPALRTVR